MRLLVGSIILFAAVLATRTYNIAQAANDPTFLQKHVAFFDRNHDGIIYPNETFEGFLALGFNATFSNVSALTVHKVLSPITRPGKPPSPLLPIEIQNIALAKHTSDTGVYDAQGNFVASRFEEIFSTHAHTCPDAWTLDEFKEMVASIRQPGDTAGTAASAAEWGQLYELGRDANGLLHKDTIRDMYDGSLFEKLEKGRSRNIIQV